MESDNKATKKTTGSERDGTRTQITREDKESSSSHGSVAQHGQKATYSASVMMPTEKALEAAENIMVVDMIIQKEVDTNGNTAEDQRVLKQPTPGSLQKQQQNMEDASSSSHPGAFAVAPGKTAAQRRSLMTPSASAMLLLEEEEEVRETPWEDESDLELAPIDVPQPRLSREQNLGSIRIPGAVRVEGPSDFILSTSSPASTPLEISVGTPEGSVTSGNGGDGDDEQRLSSAETQEEQQPDLIESGLVVANLVDDIDDEDPNLPRASQYDTSKLERHKKEDTKIGILLAGFVLFLVAIIVVVALVVHKEDSEGTAAPTQAPSEAPSTSLEGHFISLLNKDTHPVIDDPNSAQNRAFQWLLEDSMLHQQPPLTDARLIQRFALAALYYSTGGDHWTTNTNWLNHSVHECDWFSKSEFAMESRIAQTYPGYHAEFFDPSEPAPTTCNSDGKYQHLWLDQNNLIGSLPEELYLLTHLQTISLGLNDLSDGIISSQIGKLTQLEGLVIFDQPSQDGIPSEIGLLTKLRLIGLRNSNHPSTIPKEMWKLTGLESIVLMNQKNLQGTLPTEIGLFSKLRMLTLDGCDLSGTLPIELGRASSLEWLSLNGNKLTGSITTELGLLNSAAAISLERNQFSFQLPSEIGLLSSNLTAMLNVKGNQLSSTVPTEYGLLTNLHQLFLQSNRLNGPIPSELGNLSSLRRLGLANNSLSQAVPDELSNLQSSLHLLTLEGNPLLSGTVPEPLCELRGEAKEMSFDCTHQLCGCQCACMEGTSQVTPTTSP